MRRQTIVGLAALMGLAAVAAADVMPVARTGAVAMEPYGDDVTVAMLWEEVDLVLGPDRTDVKAVFGLRNTGSEDVTLDVGFPVLHNQTLEDFRVTVEGEAGPVEVTTVEPVNKMKRGQKKPESLPQWVASRNLEGWLSWRMAFPKGVERKVTVTYAVRPLVQTAWGTGTDVPEKVREASALRLTGYLLRTGQYWAGPIGRTVVRVHYGDAFPKAWVRGLRPPWRHWRDTRPIEDPWRHDEEAGTDTLVLENVEPTYQHDVEIGYKTATVVEEIGLLVEAMRDGVTFDPHALQHFSLADPVVRRYAIAAA